jgi:hypothetical protein
MTQEETAPEAKTPTLFHLVRTEDETGVSGTGVVAHGIRFIDGSCAMRWIPGPAKSTAVYDSIDDLEAIHGHGGKTKVAFIDAPGGRP